MDGLRERICGMISLWALNGSEWPSELADDILAIPEIADALRGRVVTSYLALDQNALAKISEQLGKAPSPKL